MKKVGILTLNGDYNFGNKLQNYALLNFVQNNFNHSVFTIWTDDLINQNKFKDILRFLLRSKGSLRQKKFSKFNDYLNLKKYKVDKIIDEYDYYIIGSDQVWNYKDPIFSPSKYFALFSDSNKVLSYAASFGVSNIEKEYLDVFKQGLANVKNISVREDAGKILVEKVTNRDDIEVLVDPTMLLTSDEWSTLAKKPKNFKYKKFILNYFLGNISDDKKHEIERIAKELDCEIINILDRNDPYYVSGPCEFLWLEKHASLICTDSFHSSVFAIIFNRPFVVFDRDDSLAKMSSRIDTLINKFELKNRKYDDNCITKENLSCDYSKAYEILSKEKDKSYNFFNNIFRDDNDH